MLANAPATAEDIRRRKVVSKRSVYTHERQTISRGVDMSWRLSPVRTRPSSAPIRFRNTVSAHRQQRPHSATSPFTRTRTRRRTRRQTSYGSMHKVCVYTLLVNHY